MPFFKKRPLTLSEQASPAETWIGRKLHSDLDPEACVAYLRAGLQEYGIASGDDRMFDADWAGVATTPPALIVGIWLEQPRATPPPPEAIYLAIWPEGGYDEGTYQEMALVPRGWDSNDPLPYIGHWKQNDPSLKSIGNVSGATFKVEPRF